MVAVFAETEPAKDFADDLNQDDQGLLASIADATRTNSTVTVTLPPGEKPLMGRLIDSLLRARQLAKRAVSAANLNAIAKSIFIYRTDRNDKSPATLEALMEDDTISEKMLVSPSAEGKKIDKPHYVYIQLPPSAPASLVMAYEKPAINDNEGTNVLYADAHVEWVSMDKFKKDLAATKAWLAKNGK
jgi:prepilin-type processing-associated H-X9-DG protein